MSTTPEVPMADAAVEAKNKGNAAFSKGAYEEAIRHFTDAVQLDPLNHVLYSNRSAAYAAVGKYHEAVQDADQCIDLKPEWAKGYSRKGAALHFMGKLDESIKAYQQGLQLEPTNTQIQQALQDVEKVKKEKADANKRSPQELRMAKMFEEVLKDDIWPILKKNPKTAELIKQPDLVQILKHLQQKPSDVINHMNDPRVSVCLGALMGLNMESAPPPPSSFSSQSPSFEKKEEKKEEKKKEEKKEAPAPASPAEEQKNLGNEAYKNKEFDKAIEHYNKAMQLDPSSVVYYLNRAAVYLEQGKYQDALNDCNTTIEEGRKQHVGYQTIAKAYQRIGNIYMKMNDYGAAVDAYNKSITEDRTQQTLQLLKKAEKLKEDKEKLAYLDAGKSTEAKERGNQLFRDGKFPEAIKEYSEAILRNPEDHVLYSNRAACYTKLAEYFLGMQDCEKCIKLNPKFAKAYTRKGHIHFFLKEYQSALQSYDESLKLDPSNQEVEDSIKRTLDMMNQQKNPEDALKDPEIQAILSDPVMRQILEDMQRDPKAAQDHLKNPLVMSKVQKLINSGILRTGP